jgi:AcrR family transcriptional regulator
MRNSERRTLAMETLLDASLEVLQEVGYARLRTADVAKSSGLSEGTLFRYFATKYDLVAASLERALADHLQRLIARFDEVKDRLDRRSLMELLWNVLSHPELAWTYGLYAAAATDTQLNFVLRPVLEAHSEHIDEATVSVVVSNGRINAAEAKRATNLVTWSMQGLVLSDMARRSSGRESELIEYLLFLADIAYPLTTEAR